MPINVKYCSNIYPFSNLNMAGLLIEDTDLGECFTLEWEAVGDPKCDDKLIADAIENAMSNYIQVKYLRDGQWRHEL